MKYLRKNFGYFVWSPRATQAADNKKASLYDNVLYSCPILMHQLHHRDDHRHSERSSSSIDYLHTTADKTSNIRPEWNRHRVKQAKRPTLKQADRYSFIHSSLLVQATQPQPTDHQRTRASEATRTRSLHCMRKYSHDHLLTVLFLLLGPNAASFVSLGSRTSLILT